jgi:hypothetical protein
MWVCLLAVLLVALPQGPSASELARVPRPLATAEVDRLLDAMRRALDGKTLTVTFPGREDGPEFLMGPDGRPRFLRLHLEIEGGIVGGVVPGGPPPIETTYHIDETDVVDYTGIAARRCDGSAADGDLVITYHHDNTTGRWRATAGTRPDGHIGPFTAPYADLLAGRVRASSPAPVDLNRGLSRGFTAPFSAPRTTFGLGEHPEGATQTLWVDADSLLPLRWEVAQHGEVTYTLVFNYKPLHLGPPEGIEPPRCVP